MAVRAWGVAGIAVVAVTTLACGSGADSAAPTAESLGSGICAALEDTASFEEFQGRVNQALDTSGLEPDLLLNAIDDECGQQVSALVSRNAEEPAPTEDPSATSEPELEEPELTPQRRAPIGETQTLEEWEITVTEADVYADGELLAHNSFTPEPDGRYVLVEMTLTYLGSGDSSAGAGLDFYIEGGDGRHYTYSQCGAVVPDDLMSAPRLSTGAETSASVCFDVPVAAIENANFYAAWVTATGPRAYWSLDGAEAGGPEAPASRDSAMSDDEAQAHLEQFWESDERPADFQTATCDMVDVAGLELAGEAVAEATGYYVTIEQATAFLGSVC